MSLQVGFSKISIVPDFPASLSGYGGEANRFYDKVEEPIYLTCLAFSNEKKTILVYTVDTCGIMREHANCMRERILAETGISVENIFFGSTHCHNGCSMYPTGLPQAKKYSEFVFGIAVEAAKGVLEDLSPASLFAGKKEIDGMNYTRHYVDAAGNRYSANMAFPKDVPMVGHTTLRDSELSIAKFQREKKKDIYLVNWQAHPDSAYGIGYKSICPSWIGRLRDTLEAKTDGLIAYFTGPSGNLVTSTKIPEESHGLVWFEYGEKMGELAFDALLELKPVSGEDIKTARVILEVDVNHAQDHLFDVAGEIIDLFGKGEEEKANTLLKEANLASKTHATALRNRAKMPAKGELELNAFSVGNLGFVTNTCETFGNQGLFVKAHSPFEFTFFFTGNRSYLASSDAFDYFSYEAYGGSAYYAKGTAEKMAEKLVEMLKSLK